MAAPSARIAIRLSCLFGSPQRPSLAARTQTNTLLHCSRAPPSRTALYSTASKERGDPPAKIPRIPPWLVYILLPALGVFGTLAFLKSDERNIRKHLKDENKIIGRAHDCKEVHEQDIDKWTSEHPSGIKHREHWHALKKQFEEHVDASRKP